MRKALSKSQTQKLLKSIPSWQIKKSGHELVAELGLLQFLDGLMLSARLAVYAEVHSRYPEIKWQKEKFVITIRTKELSKADISFAQDIDKIIERCAKIKNV